jgi:uncharacterized protein
LALALEHNGDLYACDHYVEPGYKLGNIMQTELLSLVSSRKQNRFSLDKRRTLPSQCRSCEVLFACNGGCPKNRVGIGGLNHLCEGYQMFFRHVNEPMRVMADLIRNKRPPADVMRILARSGN